MSIPKRPGVLEVQGLGGLGFYVALGTPTKGQPLGTYNRSIGESQRV